MLPLPEAAIQAITIGQPVHLTTEELFHPTTETQLLLTITDQHHHPTTEDQVRLTTDQ